MSLAHRPLTRSLAQPVAITVTILVQAASVIVVIAVGIV